MIEQARGRGRPPADDPTVAFRLNKSTRDKLLSHVERNLREQAGLEHAATVLECINKGTKKPAPLAPPSAQAVAAEARRFINQAVDEALSCSPRPKVWRASPGWVTADQANEVVALLEAGGLFERVLYAVLPAWWRKAIDEYEAREGETEGAYVRNQTEATMGKDDNVIPFYKHHGFVGDWSNVIESTYDLLKILEYCVSDEMNYTPEAKEKIQELIDWIRDAASAEGKLTDASNFP